MDEPIQDKLAMFQAVKAVFEVKIRKARVGRNPKLPEIDVPIPARAMVKFKAGKEMGELVLKLSPKPAK
jgi:nucleoid DNA-binding protein